MKFSFNEDNEVSLLDISENVFQQMSTEGTLLPRQLVDWSEEEVIQSLLINEEIKNS